MSTAVAKSSGKTLKDWIQADQFKDAVATALPRHLKPERFCRIAITALTRVPKLAQCTRESVFKCLLDLSALGLEPDGRRAHLIPYKDECTLVIDYKGLIELVRRSGEITDIHADVVHENDVFEYSYGSDSKLVHKPVLADRGKPIGAYSFVRLKDGSTSFDVMGVEEIERTRKSSKAANNGPWINWWGEMAKKTAFRRHAKWLPLSPELRDQIEKDDDTTDSNVEVARPKFDGASELFPKAIEAESESVPDDDSQTEPESKPTPHRKPKSATQTAPPEPVELVEIRRRCKAASLDPQTVVEFCHQTGTDETLTTLEEIAMMDAGALKRALKEWQTILETVAAGSEVAE